MLLNLMRRIQRAPAFILVVLFLISFSSIALGADSDPWLQPAREMVRLILNRAAFPSDVSLIVKNSSSLSANDVAAIRGHLISEFNASRIHVVPQERALADVGLTLSENLQGWLWVAEIHHGTARDIVMVEAPRAEIAAQPRETQHITLNKTLLWQSSAQPVLDAAVLGDIGAPTRLLVLDSNTVSFYKIQQSRWELEQSQPVPHSRPWPRDLRGRLFVPHEHKFEAYLPGVRCTGTVDPGVMMECRESDDPWPLGAGEDTPRAFFGARNFFTGVLRGGTASGELGPFFSAAPASNTGDAIWVAALDGRAKLISSRTVSSTQASTGGDVAGIKSDCGWITVQTAAGDYTRPDVLHALLSSSAGAARLEFSGPVTALWTAFDGKSAVVVSKNLSSERYEAYSVSITCH